VRGRSIRNPIDEANWDVPGTGRREIRDSTGPVTSTTNAREEGSLTQRFRPPAARTRRATRDDLSPARSTPAVSPSARLPLSERLRPSRLAEVIGNPQARAQLQEWAEQWRTGGPPAQRAALLSGPPGVGKTSAALALAADFGWSVVEMNASDARNERAIDQVAGRASISHTLLEVPHSRGPRRALILLDEADSLSGRSTESARTAAAPPILREFLRGRYGTIEALNDAWGLTTTAKPSAFESWENVPRSPGNHAWARLPPARRDIDDWKGSTRPRDFSDRGGLAAIARLVRSTLQPLVLTVNDDRVLTRYSPIFRTAVARIRFYRLRDRELAPRLEEIARTEGLDLAAGAIEAIVRRAHGDARAALNDLDAISPVPPGPLQLSLLGSRDTAADFAEFTEEVLSTARYYRSVEVRDRLDSTPDDLLPWIEENLPHFAPDAPHRAAAFDRLAAADRSLTRARRFRVWGLWSYASELLTGGVGLEIRDAPVPIAGRAQFPRFLGDMGRSRFVRAVRESVVRKSGARLHLSRAKSRETVLPFLESVFGGVRGHRNAAALEGVARSIARELDLSADEVGYLTDSEPESAVVLRLLEPPADTRNLTGTVPAKGSGHRSRAEEPAAAEEASESGRRKVQRHLSDFGSR
jgi:replication factor C large subunit